MTSLLGDYSSSPDPLGDEPPSTVRPSARRNAGNFKSIPRESSVQRQSSVRSSARSSARARPLSTGKSSPRKQTFELDVGHGRSPQRLLVTVEAESERGQRGAVSRRLFNSGSPTRSVSRKREPKGTTTVVPLRGLTDDEGDGLDEPSTAKRGRGRPRVSLGSKNGTPAPRGKKRAGTPLTKTSRAKRHSGEPPSETDFYDGALEETHDNALPDPTPKPKAKTKKTPKKAGTPAVPSSNPTGRKRGRPRKALMPEEVAGLSGEADGHIDNTTILPSEDAPMQEEIHMDDDLEHHEDVTIRDFATSVIDNETPRSVGADGSQIRLLSGRRAVRDFGISQLGEETPQLPDSDDTIRLFSGRRAVRFSSPIARYSDHPFESDTPLRGESVRHEPTETSDAPMFDDFTGEAHSDIESEADDVDEVTYSGQDNLTHASDFSMINVEALPSFQASFQSNRSGVVEEQHPFAETGDETNMIINQTLESLRRSTQTEADGHSHIEDAQEEAGDELAEEHNSAYHTRNSRSAFGSSQSSWMKSPARRPSNKNMPLSRQIFSNKAPHVDDSFSSIPDSILRTATPGRLPMKPATNQVDDDDSNMYEDEFSQIPDEVLEAATPRRPRKENHEGKNVANDIPSLHEDEAEDEEALSNSRSTNIGSDRLPTPDDTNSSTTDAKNIQGEEARGMAVDSPAIANTSDLNIRSSPPTISRQMSGITIQPDSGHTITKHFDSMALISEASQRAEQEMAEAPRNKSSSPTPLQKSGSSEQAESRQESVPVRRPTLSPIVRAGRTLQNIMSDRSSPDEHGSSLASPFRGPGQNDSRQSSIARSPGRGGNHWGVGSDNRTPFNPVASISANIRSAFASNSHAGPAPVPAPVAALVNVPPVRNVDNSLGAEPESEALRKSAYGSEVGRAQDLPSHKEPPPGLSSSIRAAMSSRQGGDIELTSPIQENDISSPANQRSRRMSASQRLANSSAISGGLSSLRNQHQDEDDDDDPEEYDEEHQDEHEEVVHEDFDDLFNLGEEDMQEEEEELEQEEQSKLEPESEGEAEPEPELEEEPQSERNGDFGEMETMEDDDDDMDLWDVEASRPTPRSTKVLRAEAQARRESQVQPRSHSPADMSLQGSDPAVTSSGLRRNKIPSPWRQNQRRLIYQDEVRSPSELELGDSPPSDAEQVLAVQPPVIQEREVEHEESGEFPRSREEEAEDSGMDQFEEQDEDEEQEQDQFQGGEELADDGSYELMENDELEEPQSLPRAQDHRKRDAALVENSVLQEYSMISQQGKPAEPESGQKSQEKPASARRSFFGKFDIMSFFSSPRPPPVTNNKAQAEETPAHTTGRPLPPSTQPSEKSIRSEPQSALRATGLFPSIKQKMFDPSPARTADLFSPGTNLRSNDTVADTYAESPSTPGEHDFPHIPQKQNFTPLSAQSRNTASLFTPSHQGSSPDREARTPSPSYDDLRENEYSGEEDEHSAEHESASTDDGPSFEQMPPREKPSQWDKNLSPAKSSLRSPLKPKTPGRVVAFTRSIPSSDRTEEIDIDQNIDQDMDEERPLTAVFSSGGAKIATSNPRTLILNPTPLRIPASLRAPEHDKENAVSPVKSMRPLGGPLPAVVSPQQRQLSPTVWTRAHWIRLDEIQQLRQRDPMRFQMVFASVLAPGKHPLAGLEVATHDAKMVLEDWHMQAVEAFRCELLGDDYHAGDYEQDEEIGNGISDANSLSKRLFALLVGEERRRTGEYVSGQSHAAGIASRKGKEVVR